MISKALYKQWRDNYLSQAQSMNYENNCTHKVHQFLINQQSKKKCYLITILVIGIACLKFANKTCFNINI